MAPRTERFELRLEQDFLDRIDEWRAKRAEPGQPPISRSEAARMLLDLGLDRGPPQLSDGDRMILVLLADLIKQQKIQSDLDPSFIIDAIHGGHYWALDWQFPGLFHGHRDKPSTLTEVLDILECWFFVENGFSQLSDADQSYVATTAGAVPRFLGFDGNYEGEHMRIAKFLVERMDRFTNFHARDFNSHVPVLDAYRRMAKAFAPMRGSLFGREMNVSELITVLQAQRS